MKNKTPSKELHSHRVFFKSEELRNQFFTDLYGKFGTWRAVYHSFNLSKTRLERLRGGEVSIPYQLFEKFLSPLNKKKQNFYSSSIFLKKQDWGRRKGGFSTYQKHPEIFQKGRILGGKVTKYCVKMNTPLTHHFSELIGAFIGDGFTSKYGTIYITQFTGHSKLDKDYIERRLCSFVKEIVPESNPRITRYGNTLRMTIYSKEFHSLLTQRFKFPSGKKTYTVVIPDEIINSHDPKMINYCIRGIFDTDGGVYFDKKTSYRYLYPRIGLQMTSKKLIKQVYLLLLKKGVKAAVTSNYRKIQINGVKNCRKFLMVIGFSNRRHLSKLKFLEN